MIESRPYEGPSDLRALQGLARRVWQADASTVDVGGTVGELAWGLGGLSPDDEWDGRLWYDSGELIAWATLQRAPVHISRPGERVVRPDTLDWQIDPACGEVVHDVLDWAEAQARDAVATSEHLSHGMVLHGAVDVERARESFREAACGLIGDGAAEQPALASCGINRGMSGTLAR